jgi:hypothetical protein
MYKKLEKTQKPLNEIKENFNKFWSKTKEIIKRETNEMQTVRYVKEVLNEHIESSKKN